MHAIKQLEIFTEFSSNILRLSISGWLSPATVDDINDEVSSHGRSSAVVFDLREAVITLKPSDIHLFTAFMESPLIFLVLPEQANIIQPWIQHRRQQGLIRAMALSLLDVEKWIDTLLAGGAPPSRLVRQNSQRLRSATR